MASGIKRDKKGRRDSITGTLVCTTKDAPDEPQETSTEAGAVATGEPLHAGGKGSAGKGGRRTGDRRRDWRRHQSQFCVPGASIQSANYLSRGVSSQPSGGCGKGIGCGAGSYSHRGWYRKAQTRSHASPGGAGRVFVTAQMLKPGVRIKLGEQPGVPTWTGVG
jgi:hypothetical protein